MRMYRAVVEDNKDPEYLGRVRVRIFGIHPETTAANKGSFISTDTLPWAEVMGGTRFGLISGVGISSVLRQGTWVWVFLEDEDENKPIVIGTIIGNNFSPDSSLGFKDPAGVYPKSDRLNSSDMHPYLNESKYTSLSTLETACGHLIQFDDSKGDERIKITHKTGTQITMDALGNFIIDVIKDGSINIKGDANILVEGYTAVKSVSDMRLSSDSNIMMKATQIQLNPDFGFPDPELTDTPNPYPRNVTPLEISEEASVEEGVPTNPEQLEPSTAVYEPLTSGKCGTIAHRNPFDAAMAAYKLGENSWKEKWTTGGTNPNIAALWTECGFPAAQFADKTAWCAIFVSACLKRSGNKYIKTASSLAYKTYGIPVNINDIRTGDIVVFSRNGGGHVGFYNGTKTSTTISVLGGNQSDRLKATIYKINSTTMPLVAIRRAVSCVDGTTVCPIAGTTPPTATADGTKVT